MVVVGRRGLGCGCGRCVCHAVTDGDGAAASGAENVILVLCRHRNPYRSGQCFRENCKCCIQLDSIDDRSTRPLVLPIL